jgi:hypothetical protein
MAAKKPLSKQMRLPALDLWLGDSGWGLVGCYWLLALGLWLKKKCLKWEVGKEKCLAWGCEAWYRVDDR